MIEKCYPGGKSKAFNISYDDGVVQDIRFVQLLNRYGLKGTFNLNYGLMRSRFTWQHESGMMVQRLEEHQVKELYQGHEVASHTYSHTYLDHADEMQILQEMGADKFFLERLMGREVAGYATPFYFYSDQMAACARYCGFVYARISEESNDYSIPRDPYHWRGSKFHWDADLESFVEGFLETKQEMALCQLVGHSYDLDVMNLWDRIEAILRMVSHHPEVWPATHLEIARYVQCMNRVEIQSNYVYNPGGVDLWFRVHGQCICVAPGHRYDFKEEKLCNLSL